MEVHLGIVVIVTIDNCEPLFVIVSKESVTDDGLDRPELIFLKSNPLNLNEADSIGLRWIPFRKLRSGSTMRETIFSLKVVVHILASPRNRVTGILKFSRR